MSTFKSYKVNERSTVAGLSAGQWLATLPGLGVGYLMLRYLPVGISVKGFAVSLTLGSWMLGVYLSGYLELNVITVLARMLAWWRADERFGAGASEVDAGFVIEAPDRAAREPHVFEPLMLADLARIASEPTTNSNGNGNGRAAQQLAGSNGHAAAVTGDHETERSRVL